MSSSAEVVMDSGLGSAVGSSDEVGEDSCRGPEAGYFGQTKAYSRCYDAWVSPSYSALHPVEELFSSRGDIIPAWRLDGGGIFLGTVTASSMGGVSKVG
ncbi:hypothetical protein CYMTET_21150 [Cymbomonas tetramitiformis]|uniref:Uncharacterized protein n=1 Tax=Cymbomonas tetramitiformis TaxID=36881 RepID=A0AAE0G2W2_9CHLO|nr:hypothetical protein CYMTET_21150 [Cymbomonas tetramitiformis]